MMLRACLYFCFAFPRRGFRVCAQWCPFHFPVTVSVSVSFFVHALRHPPVSLVSVADGAAGAAAFTLTAAAAARRRPAAAVPCSPPRLRTDAPDALQAHQRPARLPRHDRRPPRPRGHQLSRPSPPHHSPPTLHPPHAAMVHGPDGHSRPRPLAPHAPPHGARGQSPPPSSPPPLLGGWADASTAPSSPPSNGRQCPPVALVRDRFDHP